MAEKPQGPIWVDATNMLMNLPVATLVRLANIALNTMDLRTIGEVAFHTGIEIDLFTTEVEQPNG